MQTTNPGAKELKKLVIHAPNVHGGGGAVLLNLLLAGITPDISCILQVDARFMPPADYPDSIQLIRVIPSFVQRFLAEKRLRKLSKHASVVLCFGNLPPLFTLPQSTIVLLQNRYLLGASLSLLGFKLRLRVKLERLWLRYRYKNANQYWVQTETMRRLALETYLKSSAVLVKPFFDPVLPPPRVLGNKVAAAFRFIYPASNEGHKNHLCLLKAWVLLAEAGHLPELQITLSAQDEPLLRSIVSEKNLNVKFLGKLSHQHLLRAYGRVDALIFPSLFESYGLPLLEAAAIKLPIIASERDYVRDLLDPNETFDPLSEVSIMRSVMRFMQQAAPRADILSPQQFIKQLLGQEVLE